jgi:hypothetical protein
MADFEYVPLEDRTIQMTVRAEDFQGLVALENWLKGFRDGGHGAVPGNFTLVMLIRSMARAEQVTIETDKQSDENSS